jgi:hypothetical protein
MTLLFFPLLIFFFFFTPILRGQNNVEALSSQTSETNSSPKEAYRKPSLPRKAANGKTSRIRLQLPFYDSFTQASDLPDPGKWEAYEKVRIKRFSAIAPPDYGAAVLDGLNEKEKPYSNFPVRGYADTLRSQPITLAGLTPKDSVRFSFFFQRGGLCDKPGIDDTLFLDIIVNLPTERDSIFFRKKFAFDENDNGSTFNFYSYPFRDSIFFNPKNTFQVQFSNFGKKSGYYDVWHIDQVYINVRRAEQDTFLIDRTFIGVKRCPEQPYSAIPFFLLPESFYPLPCDTLLLRTNKESIYATDTLTSRYTLLRPEPALLAEQTTRIEITPFTVSRLRQTSPETFSLTRANTIETLHHFIPNRDINGSAANFNLFNLSVNDSLRLRFRADSIWSYDDFEPELGYGLRRSAGFGQRFSLDYPELTAAQKALAPDSLWMHSICFEFLPIERQPRRFMMAVWLYKDKNRTYSDTSFIVHPSQIVERTSYDTCYQLRNFDNRPSPLLMLKDYSYLVGAVQLTDTLLGVGYDMNNNNNKNIFWNNFGVWVPSQQGGTLAIRPALSPTSTPLVSRAKPSQEKIQSKLFPNPVEDNIFYISDPMLDAPIQTVELRLLNNRGSEVFCSREKKPAFPLSIPIYQTQGYYYLMCTFQDAFNRTHQKTFKIIIP